MRVAAALALGLLLVQDGDPAARVRQLLEELQSDDIVAREEAAEKLHQLGPPALPAIREALVKATGDLKGRLESAVAKIAREELRVRVMGRPAVVRLKAEQRPFAELVEQLRREHALPISARDVPADPVSVAFEGSSAWEALDALCRAHGGALWEPAGKEVRLVRRPYRARPRVVTPQLSFYLDRVVLTTTLHAGGTSPSLQADGFVTWPSPHPPRTVSITVARIADDLGNVLCTEDDGVADSVLEDLADSAAFGASIWGTALPGEGAAKLAELKGRVTATYVITWKPIAAIADPERKAPTSVEAAPFHLELQTVARDGGTVHASLSIRRRGQDDVGIAPADVHLVDDKGRTYPGHSLSSTQYGEIDGDEVSSQVSFHLLFAVPEDAKIAALEVRVPDDVENVELPFDFGGIPLK